MLDNLNIVAANLTTKYDVLRSNHFVLNIPGASTVTGAATSEDFILAVTKVTLPEYDTGEVKLNYGNTQLKVAGKTELGDFSASYRNFLSSKLVDGLIAWKAKVYNPATGIMGIASQYKIDNATLTEYDANLNVQGTGSAIRTWKINGLWISKLHLGEFNYENSDERLVEVTFKADYAWL